MDFSADKSFENQKYFQRNRSSVRVYYDGECRGEQNRMQGRKGEVSCHRKPVSINQYKKSDREHILPSGCHQKIEADCKECSIEESQELESKKKKLLSTNQTET